jgi:uncharacterized surface protein with fasciclin (FAS1) repeats
MSFREISRTMVGSFSSLTGKQMANATPSKRLKVLNHIKRQFTLPASLSVTLQAAGETTFASLSSSANLTDTLDNTPFSTFFIPSNGAFANAGTSSPTAGTANLLEGHVIPNFVGYLPNLVNGSTLTTLTGSVVTVTIQGDNYFINNALIVSSNLILENGVAHVIDQVCLLSLTFPIQFHTPSETVTDRSRSDAVIDPCSSSRALHWRCVFHNTEGIYGSFHG